MSSPRPFTPPPSGSLVGRHVIYRGLHKSSMEYMSLTHSKHMEAAHMIKGEILISGQRPGYIQYTIVLDHEWMTRKVKLSSMFGGQEKRLVLEVDQDQRWYKVTELRLNRTRSFYRSGSGLALASTSPSNSVLSSSPGSESGSSMQEADANLSDSTSCYSSSSDSECSIPFEKINLTWTPPPKGSKRASKRFSTATPLGVMSPLSCSTTTASTVTSPISPSRPSSSTPKATSPTVGFSNASTAQKTLSKSVSTTSLTGPKKYEHLPELDGCVHLDLGNGISPSTILFPLRRATLGVEPEDMAAYLAELSTFEEDPSTTETSAVLSFPDLELRPIKTHMAYVGPGHREGLSLVECWQDGEVPTLVEVDGDGLVVRYGRKWTRIPS
ncbi:hypothetical protein BGZ93_001099 [Podila epicladia]|nr:hypothetical protein BGZ92_003232 [Podila epicladia]KAG0098125.1 hypothetical protein BGZ93_001099 [Podila epicladia]